MSGKTQQKFWKQIHYTLIEQSAHVQTAKCIMYSNTVSIYIVNFEVPEHVAV